MSIVIKEVVGKRDLKKFIDFPNKLYKKNEYYVPFLFSDERATFTKKSNPAYAFCETKLFLAYIDNKIVGRIAGLINNAANEKWGTNTIRFTRFDFIDDFEVSKALMEKVISWGKERGFTSIMGPIGFTDLDHEGMLVEGFEEMNMSITFYNAPYYIEHMQKLGFFKEVDWVEYQVSVPQETHDKIIRVSERIKERYGYKLVQYKSRKVLMKEAYAAFNVVDEAFSKLFGTVPLTQEIIDKSIKDYIPIVNLKYICTIKDKDDKIVGFGLLVPSIAKALKKSNGRMFPFGVFRLLKALQGKNDILEMFLIGISPEEQSKGLPAIMLAELAKMCKKNNIKYCETGPELENNLAVQSLWKTFETRQHKRRRCWKKEI